MWKFFLIGMGLVVATSARPDACVVPSSAAGEPYATLASSSKPELLLLLDEYMYVNRWTQHSQAVAAGFRYGDRVYGAVLKRGGRFDTQKTAAWRRDYAKSGRARFLAELSTKVDMAQVDSRVAGWVLQECLAPRTWSGVRARDDCRFAFAAGLQPDGSGGVSSGASTSPVNPVRFEVRGGRCGRWPARALSEKGDIVECVRSGDSAVTVELATDAAGTARQMLAALPPQTVAPEPLQQSKLSEPLTEVVSLWRSRDYRPQQLGRGCPTCTLYWADIRPSATDAVILRADTVSTTGAGWARCPAGLRCGVYEFSPPDNPRLSGCAGVTACRVWRLAETDAEGSDAIQLTFQKPETVCLNCPEGMDFETARRRWQAQRDTAKTRCPVVADTPAQSIGRKPAAR